MANSIWHLLIHFPRITSNKWIASYQRFLFCNLFFNTKKLWPLSGETANITRQKNGQNEKVIKAFLSYV